MRAFLKHWLFLAVALTLQPEEGHPKTMPKIDHRSFAEKMGFATRKPRPANEGVVADWSLLPTETKLSRSGFAYFAGGISPSGLDQGAVEAEWDYEGKANKEQRLRIMVHVSAEGQTAAFRIMDGYGNMSNKLPNPYGPAPTSMMVGDLAAVALPEHVATTGKVRHIFWVYRNVFAAIRVLEANMDVLPLARAIQAFMERNQVDDLAAHVPKVAGLKVTPERPAVEEPFRVELQGQVRPSWRISVDKTMGDLKYLAKDGTVAEFVARAPGEAGVEAVVLDEKTLLLSRYRASITITAPK